MRSGRPNKPLKVAAEDREKLRTIALRPSRLKPWRCAPGSCTLPVRPSVSGGKNFESFGLLGLLDEPRVGAPRKISDRQIERYEDAGVDAGQTHALEHSTDGR